jgi:hypothetical protein
MLEERTKTGRKEEGERERKMALFYAAYFSGQHADIFECTAPKIDKVDL